VLGSLPSFRKSSTLTAIVLLFFSSCLFAQAAWKTVGTTRFNWGGRAKTEFIFEIPQRRNDPGDFTQVRIHVEGKKELVLTNKTGWVVYDPKDQLVSSQLRAAKNLFPSKFALARQAAPERLLVFLFGYAYASSPGSLDVLELAEDNTVRVVLHRDELELVDLRDLDGDGTTELITLPCYSQGWGNDLLTYDPVHIYKLSDKPVRDATLSLPLSKSYNLKHYYGWVGPNCSEDWAVVLHPPTGGKPIIMKARDAEKLPVEKSRQNPAR
jgi:hypothetical protein